MFISIAAKGPNAEDLSFVVQKHPAKVFEKGSLTLHFPIYEPGRANLVAGVVFPEYKLWNADTPAADAYVTSREYALSSLFCRELKAAMGSALSGNYKTPEETAKAQAPLDLVIELLPLVTTLSDQQLIDLLDPLGYVGASVGKVTVAPGVESERRQLIVDHSYRHPWMPQKTRVLGLTLEAKKPLREVLRHLLVLIPTIDNYTHYTEEDVLVAELKAHGEGWLDQHPKHEFIRARFLRHSRRLIKAYDGEEPMKEGESELEKQINLSQMRTEWFVARVQASGAKSVVDAGCGAGRLAEALSKAGVLNISAFDCHAKAVRTAGYHLENKAEVFFSSLMYRDDRLLGKDAICLQEVVEHMPEFQLGRALDLIFGTYKPKTVLMTTPNRDFNKYFGMAEGAFRHWDHKFEFSEAEAAKFCAEIERKYGYTCGISPIGQGYEPTPRLDGTPHSSVAVLDAPPKATVAATFGFEFTRVD